MKKYGTILIVDDEKEIGEILIDIFANTFEKVVYCDSAQEALSVVQATPLSVILTDYSMPGLSGNDFIIKLRALGHLTPVVFLTGHASKELAISALRLGVSDVIEKPFDSTSLLESIDRVLEIEKRKNNIYKDQSNPSVQQKKMVGLLQVVNQSKKVS
jgi:DNA-binding NtrC family response regulator